MINRIIDKYIYLRFCWNQAMGHMSPAIVIFGMVLQIGTFIKVWGIENYLVITMGGIAGIIVFVIIGHNIVKNGLTTKDISMSNKYNKEIQELLNRK